MVGDSEVDDERKVEVFMNSSKFRAAVDLWLLDSFFSDDGGNVWDCVSQR